MNQPHALLWDQYIPGGCHWSGILRRGLTLRLTDVTGGANAAMLFFNRKKNWNATIWRIHSSRSTLSA